MTHACQVSRWIACCQRLTEQFTAGGAFACLNGDYPALADLNVVQQKTGLCSPLRWNRAAFALTCRDALRRVTDLIGPCLDLRWTGAAPREHFAAVRSGPEQASQYLAL